MMTMDVSRHVLDRNFRDADTVCIFPVVPKRQGSETAPVVES